jgi:hypothetical protein
VVFTGSEPLPAERSTWLVAHAEEWADHRYEHKCPAVERFAVSTPAGRAGLDHVQITVESHDLSIHDRMVRAKGAWKQTISGLRNALDTPLFVMTNTTMLRENSPYLGQHLISGRTGCTHHRSERSFTGNGRTVGTGLRESSCRPCSILHASGPRQPASA